MDEDWHELVSQARSGMKLEKEVRDGKTYMSL